MKGVVIVISLGHNQFCFIVTVTFRFDIPYF